MNTHPMAAYRKPLAPAKYEELLASIRQDGLRVPILLYRGQIIDGRARQRACEELGVTPTYIEFIGKNRAARTEMRRLNPDPRVKSRGIESRRRIAAALIANPLAPLRIIAKQLDVSMSWVWQVRKELEEKGEIERVKALVGANGRLYRRQEEVVEEGPLRAKTRGIVAKRIQRIEELAAQRYSATQIAQILGSTEQYVRRLIHEHKIPVPKSALVGRPMVVDANRVVTESIGWLAAIANGLKLLDGAELSLELDTKRELARDARRALRVIRRVVTQLGEV